MPSQKVELIDTSQIDFDPENPRFYRLNDAHSVVAVIEEMLDDESVQDLMLSIGQKGYFEGEPLLVIKEGERYTVIEGNRRLAAVKLLNGEVPPPNRRKNSIAFILSETVEPPPKKLPCLVYEGRREILRYLGYRHITGIKEWDSLSKAKYLAQLREEFYADLDDAAQMRSLSKDIGSRPDYVAQLLTALRLYIRAEGKNFFDLPIEAKDVEFSLITTALSYSDISNWLGLESRKDISMSGLKEENLKRAFAWMFSKDQQGNTILGESRKLKDLAAVVQSTDAIEVLEETGRLSEAYLYTDGPQVALENALDQVIKDARIVWNMLPKTKPLTNGHLDKATDLFDEIKSIRNHIREKLED
ncbi:ParB/RepB/Spo0J family partition protein [Methylomonas sp. OY6]|uniref:ParB/RepB/Spo0J family partition protein n=1 Tax=Methylomonas defluvii TaxID=3045149 RepID=A0ABU4UCH3_9GAMM|nr:ParB/RepB/Spo0J family partition protein [Methylomonas sp. OY6]MDX8127171.1 ParB/RepB/Spo0J family partition protein [Methylomonas sp. OY6]